MIPVFGVHLAILILVQALEHCTIVTIVLNLHAIVGKLKKKF